MISALIFAGGTGQRISLSSKPKQFLELYGKPLIIYTLEHFENHRDIDEIVIVSVKSHMDELHNLLHRYGIEKVSRIVPGGNTGHDSIYYGLNAMKEYAKDNDIVLIHDGVRPLITEELISTNIQAVRDYGSAITVESARESVVFSEDGIDIGEVTNRNHMYIAKAPQSFYFGQIYNLYDKANKDKVKTVDSAALCNHYGFPMHIVMSTKNNIKISDPADFYMFSALHEAVENEQIFGL